MDELILSHLAQMEADGEEEDEDYTIEAATATLLMYTGAEKSHLAHAQNHLPNCLYLCQPQLCPNPRIDTPWQHLYRSFTDHAFTMMMRFDVQTFESILQAGFAENQRQYWEDSCDAKKMRHTQGTTASTNIKCTRFGGVQSEFGPKKGLKILEEGGGVPPSRSRFIGLLKGSKGNCITRVS
jgi:hypothetical protein